MSSQDEALAAFQFFADSVKVAILRQQKYIDRLEAAFLREHPYAVLPAIEYTDEEREVLERMPRLRP